MLITIIAHLESFLKYPRRGGGSLGTAAIVVPKGERQAAAMRTWQRVALGALQGQPLGQDGQTVINRRVYSQRRVFGGQSKTKEETEGRPSDYLPCGLD
jgi:hypothetical protein